MPLFMAAIKFSAASTKAVVEKPQDRRPSAKAALEAAGCTPEGILFCSRAGRRDRDLRGARCHYCGIGVDDAWSIGCILVGRDRPAVHDGGGDDGDDKGRPDKRETHEGHLVAA